MEQSSDLVEGYKDCSNCFISAPIMVDGEENLWFLVALKHSMLELVYPEETMKRIKTVFFKI